MSKHTPGPWEVIEPSHGIIVRTESPNKTKYGASRYAAIGGFDRSDPSQLSEAIANARLIAAAPDLLQALKVISVWAANGTGWKDLEDIRRLADESVNKATGDSND